MVQRRRQRISIIQENTTIRRPFKADAPTKDGPRANREIRVPRIQLIDAEGQNLGVIQTDQAMRMPKKRVWIW